MIFERINKAEYSYVLELCEQYKVYSDLLFDKLRDSYAFIEDFEKSKYRKMIIQNKDDTLERENIRLISEFRKISALYSLLSSEDIVIRNNLKKLLEVYNTSKYNFDKVGLLVPENANNIYLNREKIEEIINVLEMLIGENKKK